MEQVALNRHDTNYQRKREAVYLTRLGILSTTSLGVVMSKFEGWLGGKRSIHEITRTNTKMFLVIFRVNSSIVLDFRDSLSMQAGEKNEIRTCLCRGTGWVSFSTGRMLTDTSHEGLNATQSGIECFFISEID